MALSYFLRSQFGPSNKSQKKLALSFLAFCALDFVLGPSLFALARSRLKYAKKIKDHFFVRGVLKNY